MNAKQKINEMTWDSEDRVRSLLNALPGNILIFDDSLKTIEVFTGLNPNKLELGPETDLTRSVNKEFQEKFVDAINQIQSRRGAKYFVDKKSVGHVEFFDFKKESSVDEREDVYSCTVSCSQENQWILHILDKTEQYYKDELIEQQQDHIRSISKLSSIGEMAAGVAHEVNNPLHIITGLASKIKKKILHEEEDLTEIIDYAARIEATVMRISKIVTGLSQLARKDSIILAEDFKLMDMVQDVVSISAEKFSSSGVELTVEIDEKLIIHGKKVQLSQVVLNFVNNAFDAITENEGPWWIKIKAKQAQGMLKLSVVDNGAGIDDSVATKMFDPFFTTKPPGKGTGLGTSISKQIIDDHGGKIGYELYDGNTSFYFEIPMKTSSKS